MLVVVSQTLVIQNDIHVVVTVLDVSTVDVQVVVIVRDVSTVVVHVEVTVVEVSIVVSFVEHIVSQVSTVSVEVILLVRIELEHVVIVVPKVIVFDGVVFVDATMASYVYES